MTTHVRELSRAELRGCLEMDAASIQTVQDLERETNLPRKRKYTTKACAACRKLKIRCRERTATDGTTSCEHCVKAGSSCSWPEVDARKWNKVRQRRPSTPSAGIDAAPRQDPSPDAEPSLDNLQETDGKFEPPDQLQNSASINSTDNSTSSPAINDAPHRVLQYYRYLGSTAIAPGYKKISLKAKNDDADGPDLSDSAPDSQKTDNSSLFESSTNHPRAELLPHLLDAFFEYYGGTFCFLNRQQLEKLISTNEISSFLLCSLAALSARFCSPHIFEPYFLLMDGQDKDRWQYSLPFLIEAKKLLMPLLSIPSCDLVAGLLFLALAEFGDNNEAGNKPTPQATRELTPA